MKAGLCSTCRWARIVDSKRGSKYLRCGLSERDATFEKYPRLPRDECRGHEAAPRSRSTGGSPAFERLDLKTMERRVLTKFETSDTMRTFDIAPDNKRIVVDRLDEVSAIALIEVDPKS